MPTYAEGATVERRYPGPNAEAARAAADPQIAAFLAAGFVIANERWLDDAQGGAPIGDAIASGPLSYLAGSGGSLAVTYLATRPTDLPAAVPAYTLRDPREAALQTWSQARIAIGIAGAILALLFFLFVLGQMSAMSSRMPGFGY